MIETLQRHSPTNDTELIYFVVLINYKHPNYWSFLKKRQNTRGFTV